MLHNDFTKGGSVRSASSSRAHCSYYKDGGSVTAGDRGACQGEYLSPELLTENTL